MKLFHSSACSSLASIHHTNSFRLYFLRLLFHSSLNNVAQTQNGFSAVLEKYKCMSFEERKPIYSPIIFIPLWTLNCNVIIVCVPTLSLFLYSGFFKMLIIYVFSLLKRVCFCLSPPREPLFQYNMYRDERYDCDVFSQ